MTAQSQAAAAPADKPVAQDWFSIEAVAPGLRRVRERHVDPYLAGNIWIVDGAERHLLVDTGTGIGDLRGFVDDICDKPVIAVALNCFYDHAGGLHGFEDRWAHAYDADALAAPTPQSSVSVEFVSDDMLLALPPPGYSTRDYALRPAPVTRTLADGDRIDLGGRVIKVLHTPGATMGSLCLWEAETGALFTSDTLLPLPDGQTPRARNPVPFRTSMLRLSDLPAVTVYPGHYDPFDGVTMRRMARSVLHAPQGGWPVEAIDRRAPAVEMCPKKR